MQVVVLVAVLEDGSLEHLALGYEMCIRDRKPGPQKLGIRLG